MFRLAATDAGIGPSGVAVTECRLRRVDDEVTDPGAKSYRLVEDAAVSEVRST
jgi:hypothetical protein